MRHTVRTARLVDRAGSLLVAEGHTSWFFGVGHTLEGRPRIEVLAVGIRILVVAGTLAEVGILDRSLEGIGCMDPT